MPARVAEVQTKINSRKNDINMAPAVHAEGNAIRRRTVNTMRFEAVEANTFEAQRSRCGNRMPHRRLLHIGGDDAHVSESLYCFRQRQDPWTVNTIIV